MAVTPVRFLNLVAPLAHKATAMRIEETAGGCRARSCAVSAPIGIRLRRGDVFRAHRPSTRPTTPGCRASRMATRTSTTRTTPTACASSADSACTLEDVVQAYLDCRRHKRSSASAVEFEQRLGANLIELYESLLDRSYRPGRSICFVITRPKPREVWAADFRDRIVHHLLYNRIAGRFHAAFIADSCACIPGRGTLYAAKRLEHQVRSITQNWSRPAYYLKCDVSNFFVSIDKTILAELLHARVIEPWWRWLTDTVLFHDPRTDVEIRSCPALLERVPPHKRVANAAPYCGLPIGNLSSQFFANVYLNALDQHVKHQLHARRYVRYVDDFILLHESTAWLNAALVDLTAFLPARLRLDLNPRKTVLQPIARGADFVGQVIRPWRRTTRAKTVRAAAHRLAELPNEALFESGNSYLGLLRQASHSHADLAQLANILRRRGHCVAGDLSKIYRRADRG